MTDLARSLDRLGQAQHGLVTAAQLAALGQGRGAVRRLERIGQIARVRAGVYRLCGVAPTWRTMARAAVLAAGDGAVLSHESAGILWGLLDRFSPGASPLHVTAPAQRRLAGVVAHRGRLTPGDVTRLAAIPVTGVERTLFDLARSLSAPGQAEVGGLVDEALRRRLTTPGRLLAVLERHHGHGGRRLAPFRAALADRGLGYDPGANRWEQEMDRMWDRMGLPQARRQYRITVAGGRSYKPDRAILDARIAVDWNGYGPHGTRSRFDYDSDRRARLVAAGWLPLDFTSRSSPELICTTVLHAYRERLQLLRASN